MAQANSEKISPTDCQPLIRLVGLRKTYEEGRIEALRDVNLTIEQGEFLSIMGPSGCGKSTMLNMLGGLDRPTSGDVFFEDASIATLSNIDAFRAKKIGFVFQSFYLLPNLTAAENVQLPMFEGGLPLDKRAAEAERLLGMVGLADRMKHLPNQLSIGQRQRVAIARALANSPAVILADEPTGSLDSKSGAEIMEILGSLNREHGTTLIIVTHDERVAQYGRRLIKILDGEILSDEPVGHPEVSSS